MPQPKLAAQLYTVRDFTKTATDLAASLGLTIVGVSHECDHPRAAFAQSERCTCDQGIMFVQLATIEGAHCVFDQLTFEPDMTRKLDRHGRQGRRERSNQSDAGSIARNRRRGSDRVIDHRCVGFQNGYQRMSCSRVFNAGTKRGTGEQNAAGAGGNRVVSQSRESRMHGGVEPATTARKIGRQRIVQQIHQYRLRPLRSKSGINRRNRMRKRVNERDSRHGGRAVRPAPGDLVARSRPCLPRSVRAADRQSD